MTTTYENGMFYLESPADEFIRYFTRKDSHVSFFFAAEDLRFEIKSRDDLDDGTFTVKILGNLISRSYNTVHATLTVTPDEEDVSKTRLEYTLEFEKNNNNIPESEIVESLLTYILISDYNNSNSFKLNAFDAPFPAEECFRRYYEAFENDANLKMEHVDNRTFTVSFNPDLLMRESDDENTTFRSIELTVTSTPKNNSSRVKWTIKVVKINDYTEESDQFLMIAYSIGRTMTETL